MPIGKSSALLFFEFRNDITNMSPLIDTRVRVPCPCVAPEPRGGRCALAAGPVCAARRLATASSRGARAERKFYNPMNGRGREGCYCRVNILISNIVYAPTPSDAALHRCGERPRTSEQRPRDVCDCEFRWALSALYVTRPTVGYFFVSLSYQSSSIFRCSSGTPGWPKPRTGHGQFS